MTMMPIAFGLPGGYEFLVVAFVALLIFGNRLPSVMKSLGKSVTEFKKGVAGIEDDLDTAATADKKPVVTETAHATIVTPPSDKA